MQLNTVSSDFKVKICGTTESSELNMLDKAGVDYAGLWFLVPDGKYSLNRQQFSQLSHTPLNHLKCIGVTTENNPDVIAKFVQDANLSGIQLHGFQLPKEVAMIKSRLGNCELLKVLHIQKGNCLEKPLLKEYAKCGADAFILDNFISRQRSGSTGERIPAQTVEELVDILGSERLFLAGGLDDTGIRSIRSNLPLLGVDIDSGARVAAKININKVHSIVAAARGKLN
jgi:phosphoribosylanthranilate isomerase